MTLNNILSQGLDVITYNSNKIKIPKDKPHIYMGIGLYSKRDGLSEALPIDVMQMLLPAKMMSLQIKEANLGKPSRVIILIADSMAIREGAKQEQVSKLTEIYKKSLMCLLDLLDMTDDSEIVLSSELEKCTEYQKTFKSIENSEPVRLLKIKDPAHCAYIISQTANTICMNEYRNVGIKVGWIRAESNKQLNSCVSPESLKSWDELSFDLRCGAIRPDLKIQYLYTRAGLNQSRRGKYTNVSEGCPYTAYHGARYVVRPGDKGNIITTYRLQKRVSKPWRRLAEVCWSLMQENVVSNTLLPKDCIQKNHAIATVYNMLNHWCYPPLVRDREVGDLASIFLLNTDLPPLEEFCRAEVEGPKAKIVAEVVEEPKPEGVE